MKTKSKYILSYSICFLVFLLIVGLTGTAHFFSSSVSFSFSLIAHLLLLLLLVFWMMTLYSRMKRRKERNLLLIVGFLLLCSVALDMFLSAVLLDNPYSDFISYFTYIPKAFIPFFLFFLFFGDGRLERGFEILLFSLLGLLSSGASLLALTNSLSHLFFAETGYGPFFYVFIGYEAVLTAVSLVFLILRARKRGHIWKGIAPVFLYLLFAALGTISFFLPNPFLKEYEIFTFATVVLLETSIACSLFDTKEEYFSSFASSPIPVFLTDQKFRILYQSSSSISYSEDILSAALKEPFLVGDGLFLFGKKISGGYVFYISDEKKKEQYHKQEEKTLQQMEKVKQMIPYLSQLEEDSDKTKEKNTLYDEMQKEMKGKVDTAEDSIHTLLSQTKTEKLSFEILLLRLVFIRRESELYLFSQRRGRIEEKELFVAFKDIIDTMNDFNKGCSLSFIGENFVSFEDAKKMFSFLEENLIGKEHLAPYLYVLFKDKGSFYSLSIIDKGNGEEINKLVGEREE